MDWDSVEGQKSENSKDPGNCPGKKLEKNGQVFDQVWGTFFELPMSMVYRLISLNKPNSRAYFSLCFFF